ncbi:MAG: trigger factor, partial [Candidatus Krumholzibacteria bacterium]|nr:trigger factor [Candidatus Krumholzibacteria bacterium]
MERKLDEQEISMNVSEEPNCRRVISVEIAPDCFQDEKERVLRAFVKKTSVPGFRKGKVPPGIVRRRFADEIHAEALKKILPLAYGHVVTSEKLEPIGEPVFSEIKVEDDEPLTFQVDVEVFPKIELSDFRQIEVKSEPVSVEEDEIEGVLKNLQEREAEYVTVDRSAVTSDIVVIDFGPVGIDDKVKEGKLVSDYPVQLGTGQLFADFEKAIAGTTKGATARVEIEYPEDHKPEHLASRKVLYEFTVKEVREKRVPPLNDEFAARIDPAFTNLSELREDISRRLSEEKERDGMRRREGKAIDLMIERFPFDVPGSLVEKFKGELYREDEKRRKMAGVGPEDDEEKKRQL